MTFTKRFPKDIATSPYPQWIEVTLSDEEERSVEESVRKQHAKLLVRCVQDAKQVAKSSEVHADPAELVSLAKALFDKQASHVVFHKEARAREKFEQSTP